MVNPYDQADPSSQLDSDTESRILDAAHRVFVLRGTAGARMQEVADEAGVNKALLHYYFRSKDRLAEAVFARVARALFVPMVGLLASDLPLEEKVRSVVAHELEHLSRSPFLPGYMLSEMQHYPERLPQLIASAAGMSPEHIRERLLGGLRAQIEERVRAGTMRPIDAEQFLVNLVSLCVFPFAAQPMVRLVLGLGEQGFRDFIEARKTQLAEFFLQAVRP
ncbi:MAG TPA: helix-turn-helix domain-containing protein [Gemmatimonadaceae bacterium]|nr:helix-turn-helix domain-containing protein [Gemmatimonadaceae bacterium]